MYRPPSEFRGLIRSPSLPTLLLWKDNHQSAGSAATVPQVQALGREFQTRKTEALPTDNPTAGYPPVQRKEDDESRAVERQITLDKLEGRITPEFTPGPISLEAQFHRDGMPLYLPFIPTCLTPILEEDENEIQEENEEAIGEGSGSFPNPTVTGVDGYEDENAELDAAAASDDNSENGVAIRPGRRNTVCRDLPEITHPAFNFGWDDTCDVGSRVSDDSCFDGHERVRPAEVEKPKNPAPDFTTELRHEAPPSIFLVKPGCGGATQVTRQNSYSGTAPSTLTFRQSQEPAPGNALIINDLRNSAQNEVSEENSGTLEEIRSPAEGVSISNPTPGKFAKVMKAVKSLFKSRRKTLDRITAETIRVAPRGFRALKGKKCMSGSPDGKSAQGGADGGGNIAGPVAKTRLTVEELSRVKSQCGVIENGNFNSGINADNAPKPEPLLDEQAMLPSPYGGIASGTSRGSSSSAFDSFDPAELRTIARILRETSGDRGCPAAMRVRSPRGEGEASRSITAIVPPRV